MKDLIGRLYGYTHALERAMRDNSSDIFPLAASVKVTSRCNSRCRYCHIWARGNDDIPQVKIERIIDELASLGVQVITLTGGEALMRDDLPAIVARIRSHRMIACLNSNGILLGTPRLNAVIEAGLHAVTLSLDTMDADVYQRVRGIPLSLVLNGLDAIAEIQKTHSNLNASVNCVVSRANLNQILPLVERCHAHGIPVGFQPIHRLKGIWAETEEDEQDLFPDERDAPELFDLFNRLAELKKKGYLIANEFAYLRGIPEYLAYRRLPPRFKCIAGFTSIGIDDSFNVYSCVSMQPIGNLRETSLLDIWRSKAYESRRAEMLALRCPGCWLRCHSERCSDEWLEGIIKWIIFLNLPADHKARAYEASRGCS